MASSCSISRLFYSGSFARCCWCGHFAFPTIRHLYFVWASTYGGRINQSESVGSRLPRLAYLVVCTLPTLPSLPACTCKHWSGKALVLFRLSRSGALVQDGSDFVRNAQSVLFDCNIEVNKTPLLVSRLSSLVNSRQASHLAWACN